MTTKTVPLHDNEQNSIENLLKSLELLTGKIEFGKVELLFHQGRLVQLEKTEKLRFDQLKRQ